MENVVLLFSGGVDSYIAYHYLKKPKTVYFDTGSEYAKQEIAVIKKLVPDTIIDKSLCLTERQSHDKNAFVPMRNLYLAMLATHYGDNICLAGLKDDVVNDKNEAIFGEFTKLLSVLNEKPITVFSPFWDWTKADVVKWFSEEHPKLVKDLVDVSISCYTPKDGKSCRTCPSCFRKWTALWVNDIKTDFNNWNLIAEYHRKAEKGVYDKQRNFNIMRTINEYRKYKKLKTYAVDIDGVLTKETEGHDYSKRTPNKENIAKVNKLYTDGNEILLFSSRYSQDSEVTQI